MRRDVSDEQATLISTAIDDQRRSIAKALDRLARRLSFNEDAGASGSPALANVDVLRAQHTESGEYLFVGIARGFAEPIQDVRNQESVRYWVRRFARLVDPSAKAPARIAGGYVVVGTHDDASAYAWAALLTKLARPHRIHRDGAPVRFVVRRLGAFWMAC